MKRKIILSTCVLLLLCNISSIAQVKKGNEKSPLPIIDVHLHAFKITPDAPNENIKVYAPGTGLSNYPWCKSSDLCQLKCE